MRSFNRNQPRRISVPLVPPTERASHKNAPPPRPASGFTLLEVLVALTLSVILLSAVYSALDLHYKYSAAGRADVERSQLARALLSKIASDIRCVVYRESEEEDEGEGTEESDESSESEDETDTSEIVVDTADSFASQDSGVYGDLNSLVIHISRPTRERREFLSTATADEEVTSSGGDLKSVSYFLAGSDSGGLQELAAEISSSSSSDDEPAGGLARLEGDRLAMNLADEQGDLQTLASETKILAEEVEYLEFQYFDGLEWIEEWDSSEYGALPSAIRIIIEFRAPEEAANPMFTRVASSSTDRFELVVSLPLAKPFASLEL